MCIPFGKIPMYIKMHTESIIHFDNSLTALKCIISAYISRYSQFEHNWRFKISLDMDECTN